MGATPVCTIDATGNHVPDFNACLTYFQGVFQGVYGSDLYLGADSQDGQFVGLLALALNDVNAECAAAYNSRGPATAQGAGLSSIVKINGITRDVASYSTCDVLAVGQAGTVISNGMIGDGTNKWLLPATVTIPLAGQITVTATAASAGALTAPANTLTKILTPTRGWQSVTNPNAATPGAPVETDAALRIRQAQSTALPSLAVLDGIVGAATAVPGVTVCIPYENTGNAPDANGLPGHTIALVVEGGDTTAVANAINLKKTGGAGTYGNTSVAITDAYGITKNISFFRRTAVPVTVSVGIRALPGFTAAIQAAIQTAVVNWVNAVGTGQTVRLSRGYVSGPTFEMVYLYAGRGGSPPSNSDVAIAINEYPTATSSNVTVTLVS